MRSTNAQDKANSIPLGRRIGEIMEEKGDAFSLRAFANRIGISKDILSRCINGERYIKPSELEKIAKGLNMSIGRIKEDDTKRERDELENLLRSTGNPKRALELSKQIATVAIGITERCVSLNQLGRALFLLKNYEEANTVWQESHKHAKKIAEKYGETELLYNVITNISILLSVTKKHIELVRLLGECESALVKNPIHAGKVCYSHASIAYTLGDVEEARKFLRKSLYYFELVDNERSIGKAEHTLACVEYTLGNYVVARELFERAVRKLEKYKDVKYISIKDYVKSLLKLKESEKAEEIIRKTLQELELIKNIEFQGIYLLLLAIATDDKKYAERVLEIEKTPLHVQRLVCKFLATYYMDIDDSDSFMKYSKIAETLSDKGSDILDEEEF